MLKLPLHASSIQQLLNWQNPQEAGDALLYGFVLFLLGFFSPSYMLNCMLHCFYLNSVNCIADIDILNITPFINLEPQKFADDSDVRDFVLRQ